MCFIITKFTKEVVLDKDLTVFKQMVISEEQYTSPYWDFTYSEGLQNRVPLVVDSERRVSAVDFVDLEGLRDLGFSVLPELVDPEGKNPKAIHEGYHSFLSEKRAKLDLSHLIIPVTIPKGTRCFIDEERELIVSETIIIPKFKTT